jgi:hypothetical protein
VENLGCEPTIPYAYASANHSAAYGNTYCNGTQNRDVWYKFTVPANGEATVSIAYSGYYNMAMEFILAAVAMAHLLLPIKLPRVFLVYIFRVMQPTAGHLKI